MIIRDRVEIAAPAEAVWAFVCDPANQPRWNPKVRDVDPISHGEPERGFRYRITYVMSGRESQMEAEMIEFDAPRKLVIRMEERIKADAGAYQRSVKEEYTLIDSGGRTRLEQKITVLGANIPIFFRIVISLLMRFGKPTGPRYLETLKDIVEGRAGNKA